ncbi:MAG: rRNA maturation RNase YbeY [Deltaproteobacteria bacterium]|nr:rRNA maturation RNase YbeY [Deltaproteobacteria bacterium]
MKTHKHPILTRKTLPPEIDPARLDQALNVFLTSLGHQGRTVSLLLTGNEELAELNRDWRGLPKPTDVLSWSYLGPGNTLPEGGVLGDLAISLEKAAVQAEENGWDLPTEVLRLMAHGCAHLAGYDHNTQEEETVMRRLEISMLAAIGLSAIYPE